MKVFWRLVEPSLPLLEVRALGRLRERIEVRARGWAVTTGGARGTCAWSTPPHFSQPPHNSDPGFRFWHYVPRCWPWRARGQATLCAPVVQAQRKGGRLVGAVRRPHVRRPHVRRPAQRHPARHGQSSQPILTSRVRTTTPARIRFRAFCPITGHFARTQDVVHPSYPALPCIAEMPSYQRFTHRAFCPNHIAGMAHNDLRRHDIAIGTAIALYRGMERHPAGPTAC